MTGSEQQATHIAKFPLVGAATPDVAALVAVIRRLSVARSIEEIMEIVTHAARNLLDADGITFVLREGDLCHYAEEDAIAPLWKGKRFPMSACISGWCMTERKAAVIPDIYQDPRIPRDAYRPTFVRSLAMVPVRQDDPIAAMGAYWKTSRDTSAAELELLQAIGNAAGLAVAKIELEQEREKARKAEFELAHRFNNLLAVIEAMSHQTLRRAKTPDAFVESFSGRIQALARAQRLLMQSKTTGADLRALISEQLLIGQPDERISCHGPDVFLPPEVTFELGLLLHELGTNARKYGALSVDTGKVAIDWNNSSAGPRTLELSWTERGGPLVSAPDRHGLGSTLLHLAFKKHNGSAEVRYEPSGIVCSMRIPLP